MPPINPNVAMSVGGSVANSLLGNAFSRERDDYNAEQARINRAWQERMMNYSNWYNSPMHQLEMYQQAGLNPALLTGESFVPSQAGAGATAQSSGAYTPFDIGAGIDSAYSAEVNKQNAETVDQLRTGQVRLQGLEYRLGLQNMRFTEKQMEEMAANITRMNDECLKLRAEVEKLKSEKQGQDILNSINKKIDDRKVEEIDLSLKYTKELTWKAAAEKEAAKALARLYFFQGSNSAIDLFVNKGTAFSQIRSGRLAPVTIQLQNERLVIENAFNKSVTAVQGTPTYQWIDASLNFLGKGIGVVYDAVNVRNLFLSKGSRKSFRSGNSSSSFSF